jgi:PAS domain S-box-containing protein
MKGSLALNIALLYWFVGILWIFSSLRLPWLMADDPALMATLSIPKAVLFFTLTSVMLYILIRRGSARVTCPEPETVGGGLPPSADIEQMENALAESEKRLQDILNRAPSVVYVKDRQGRYSFVNRHFERLSGFKREEVLNRTDFELFPRDVALQSVSNDRKALGMAVPLETEEVAPVGSEMHTFISAKFPLCDPQGQAYAICGISTDINARKMVELEKERLIGELQGALSKVKLLSGFLPICAHCKKIRNDKGYWQQIEAYIHEHSEAEFSHGLCPECAKKLYPPEPSLDASASDPPGRGQQST